MGRPVLAVVGYVSIDRIRAADGRIGETIGGATVYASLAAARTGVDVRLLAAVGEDLPERWLGALARAGVDVGAVERRPGATRRALLSYDRSERRLAAAERSADWWTATRTFAPPVPTGTFDGCLACPMPLPLLRQVEKASGDRLLVADTSEVFAAAGPTALDAFSRADIFAPSLDEIRLLAGGGDDERAIDAVAARVRVLVAKLGRDGLRRVAGDDTLTHRGDPAAAVDPTGAGDAAVGALGAAALLGRTPLEQLTLAADAGRQAISDFGPRALGFSEKT